MVTLPEMFIAMLASAVLASVFTLWLMLRRLRAPARLLRLVSHRAASVERLAGSVFNTTSEGILVVDSQMHIIEANRAFQQMSGYTREQLLGQHPRMMQSGRQDAAYYAAMWKQLTTQGHWQGRIWDRRRDGSLFAAYLTLTTVRDRNGRVLHYIGLFADVTAESLRQEQIEQMAFNDALTGLPNRRLLNDRLAQALAQAARSGKRVAVCVMDLDGFKAVNDNLGHEAGDAVLVEVAGRLLQAVRANDTVARTGGDEFVLVLAELDAATGESEADEILVRTLHTVRQPVILPAGPAQVSASIGVALYPNDAVDADELLRQADSAMYSAKHLGRDRCSRAQRPARA